MLLSFKPATYDDMGFSRNHVNLLEVIFRADQFHIFESCIFQQVWLKNRFQGGLILRLKRLKSTLVGLPEIIEDSLTESRFQKLFRSNVLFRIRDSSELVWVHRTVRGYGSRKALSIDCFCYKRTELQIGSSDDHN